MQSNEAYFTFTVAEAAAQLQTDPHNGLTEEEAARRLALYGPNSLEEQHPEPWWHVLWRQFISPLALVLLFAAVLSMAFKDWLDGAAILLVLFINALIGFVMEWQAQRSMQALRRLARVKARVIREKQLREIPAEEIVPGDLLFMEAGDIIPADARLVHHQQLQISEAILTGESLPVEKQTAPLPHNIILAERSNMIFKGCSVIKGNAHALATATGSATQLGQIALLTVGASKANTPLEQKLEALGRRLIKMALLASLLVLVMGLWQGRDLLVVIETAIALAVAAIPEGLPVVATIALANGMLRLARHRVIVRQLTAVETLGEVSVILTDKTGTITENQLAVKVVATESGHWNPTDTYDASISSGYLPEIASLCNNASIDASADKGLGDPLELALLQWVHSLDLDPLQIRAAYPRVGEIPFDSETRLMITIHPKDGRYWVLAKGAPESLLPMCRWEKTVAGVQPLDSTHWLTHTEAWAVQGLRPLAFAFLEAEQWESPYTEGFTFAGLIGFIDPPRKEVRNAIEQCRQAGIKVVMLTGDHPATARHIAQLTGMVDNESAPVVTGDGLPPLEQLAPEDKKWLLEQPVFARISPAQKLELATLYQEEGHVIAMTGDGINDAPALKKADAGIAMGRRGSEAAKEVADLVLEDDSFPAIVTAIRQGRVIFDNIRSFVVYLLSCNISELLIVTLAVFTKMGTPLLPLQILFVNMITDVFPALALGVNPAAKNTMLRPPRPEGEALITPKYWRLIFYHAIWMTLAVMGALTYAVYFLKIDAAAANTMTFYALVLVQLCQVFNLPERGESFWRNSVTTNKYIWMALPLCLFLLAAAYAWPLSRNVLQLQPLNGQQWMVVLLAVLLPLVIVQSWNRVLSKLFL